MTRSSLPTAQSSPPRMLPFDQILAGSFAPGTVGECGGSEMVLVSWNIARGVRLREILQALRGPLAADLYLLQEVDLHTRRAGCRHVVEEIARELAMHYVFGIEFQELAQDGCGSAALHGQALLSRFPISGARVLRFRHQLHNWERPWLPRWSWLQPRRGGRMALVVEIQCDGRTWLVYNTHLESKANDERRRQQIREILEDSDARYAPDMPVILAGDLNTTQGATSPVLQDLRADGFQDVFQNCKGPLGTKVGSCRRADWILLRHLCCGDARIVPLDISDHYPLVVHLAGRGQAS